MATLQLYDSQRRSVSIGRQIAKAGEGTILEVADGRNLVAKVYHTPSPVRAEKLRYMVQVSNQNLSKLAAWPVDTLHTNKGDIIGFMMPRIANAKEIHELYSPRDRKTHFPDSTFKFLVRAASNTARAFAVLHQNGHIVGDVNHGNFLISTSATVALVDCDSFQVQSPHRNYLCQVGVATHTPPELQDADFASVLRTKNHDAFGLAVLIFQLLFMGRHPFSGGFLGAGEMPIERAIKEFRFAYGDGARSRQMQPPPNTLPLSVVPTNIALLFDRAFSREGVINGRPGASQWVAALDALEGELSQCRKNNRHIYYRSLTLCPWCDLESKTGVVYFATKFSTNPTGQATFPPLANIEELWKRIQAVELPIIPYENISAPIVGATEEYINIAQKRRNLIWKTFNFLVIKKARQDALARQAAAEQRLSDLQTEWVLADQQSRFRAIFSDLEKKRKAFHALDFERQKKIDQLNSQIREGQLRRHLESSPIRAGIVPGIGPAKEMALKSYGIDTAYNLTSGRILQVPGFGPSLASKLLLWRRTIESRFRFDPSKGIDAQDIAKVDAEIYAQRKRIIEQLTVGPASLKSVIEEMEKKRKILSSQMRTTTEMKMQAQADYDALS